MTRLATLTLSQGFTTSTAAGRALVTDAVRLDADVLVLDSPPGHVELNQAFDGTAVLIQPRLQLVGAAAGTSVDYPAVIQSWTVGGADPLAILQGDLTVGADLEACARTWSRSVIASTGSRRAGDHALGPLGYETTRAGPPPGPSVPVNFDLELRGTGSLLGTNSTLRLLTSGYVETSDRSAQGDPGGGLEHIMELSGSGPEVLYRDVEIDLELAPDHGLTHGQIAIAVLQAAGVPAEMIGIDPQLGKPRSFPVRFSCTSSSGVLHEVLRPIGYVAMPSREDGVVRAVTIDVTDEDVVMMDITEVDINAEAALKVQSDGTQPTCIEVTGHRLADTGTGAGSGTVTSRVVVSTFEDDFVALHSQAIQLSGASTITPTGNSPPAPRDGVRTRRVTVEVTTTDGCEDLTYTRTEGYFNPVVARYAAAATDTGEPRTYPAFNVQFFDGIPTGDDATEGHLWQIYRFVTLSEVWAEPQFRADGRRVGTVTRQSGWRNILSAAKNRLSPAAPWHLELYEVGPLSAAFEPLHFDQERYFVGPGTPDALFPSGTHTAYPGITVVNRHTQVDVETRVVDECDYQPELTNEATTYGRRAGTTQLYSDLVSRDATEVGVSSSTTTLHAVVNGRLKTVSSGVDSEGRTTPTTVTDSAQGGIPGAEICDADAVAMEAEQSFSVTVCLTRVDSAGDQVQDTRKPITLDSVFVETPAEAEAWGALELRVLHAYVLEVELASPAPILDAGMTVSVDIPELGFSSRLCKVVEPTTVIEGGGGGKVVQELTLRVPPA